MKPLTAQEIKELIKELTQADYDNEVAHCRYDGILERYCLYPDPKLAALIKQLITKIRPQVNFWCA